MIPIWWCIVKFEPLLNGISCYRIVKAIKTTIDQSDRLYQEHGDILNVYTNPPHMVMYFHREPDETPLTEIEEGKQLAKEMGLL